MLEKLSNQGLKCFKAFYKRAEDWEPNLLTWFMAVSRKD